MIAPIKGPTAAPPAEQAQIQKVAKQFEAIFLRQMIGAMRSASLGDGALDSSATEQFRDLADARTADAMADKGGIGIAEMLTRQLAPKASPPPAVKTTE